MVPHELGCWSQIPVSVWAHGSLLHALHPRIPWNRPCGTQKGEISRYRLHYAGLGYVLPTFSGNSVLFVGGRIVDEKTSDQDSRSGT